MRKPKSTELGTPNNLSTVPLARGASDVLVLSYCAAIQSPKKVGNELSAGLMINIC